MKQVGGPHDVNGRFREVQRTVAVGATGEVFNLRDMAGLMTFLNTGTATWQPCNDSGTVVPGSSATSVASGTFVPTPWPFVKVVATTAACVTAPIGRRAPTNPA